MGAWPNLSGWVREGVSLPPHLGGMRERCKLPHRGLGRSPEAQLISRNERSKVRIIYSRFANHRIFPYTFHTNVWVSCIPRTPDFSHDLKFENVSTLHLLWFLVVSPYFSYLGWGFPRIVITMSPNVQVVNEKGFSLQYSTVICVNTFTIYDFDIWK